MKGKCILLLTFLSTFLSLSPTAVAAVDMSAVELQLGEAYSVEVETRLDNAPTVIQDNWDTYADVIKLTDTSYTNGIAYYSYENGIFLDLEEDANRDSKISSKKKYANLFHEIGHSIAYHLSDTFTDVKGDCISNTYSSKKYHCTLTQMLKREEKTYFKKVRKTVKSDKKAWAKLNKELKAYKPEISYEASDIWDGVSNGKAYAYCGHTIVNKDYWKSHSAGCEAFANMYEASINNKQGTKLIKKYFPKSYEIFEEELKLGIVNSFNGGEEKYEK